MVRVAGADAARIDGEPQWVLSILERGQLDELSSVASLSQALEEHPELEVIAVDIPIGHEDRDGQAAGGRRAADAAARERLGPRSASVFSVPPIDLLDADEHADAVDAAQARGTIAPSVQVWNLRERILEADALAREDDRLREAHPEVSFHVMSVGPGRVPSPLAHKRSWNGVFERLSLLEDRSLTPPDSLGTAGSARTHDVLDATAVAWTAHRIAHGEAVCFPPEPPEDPATGRPVAIHA